MALTATPTRSWAKPAGVRAITASLLLVTVIIGVVAVSLVRRNAVDDHRDEELRTSQLAAHALSEVGIEILAELRGASGLVGPSGAVDSDSFHGFAADVIGGSVFASVAREGVVSGSERSDFESRNGLSIVERDATGALVPSSVKSQYLPVVDVWPITEATKALLGFDIASDPVRNDAVMAAAARASPTVSAPVLLATSNTTAGYFAVQPLYRTTDNRASSADVVGYVSAAFPITTLIDRVLTVLPPGSRIALRDVDFVTTSNPPPRATAASSEGSFGGRSISVAVDTPGGPARASTVLTAVAALALLLGLLATTALTRRIARDGQRASLLAELARKLAATRSTAETYDVLRTNCGAVLGASSVEVRRTDPATVLVGRDVTASSQLVPLRSAEGATLGVLELGWPDRSPANRRRRSLVSTVADVAAQALDRASQVEEVADRASNLATLARDLAAGSSTEDLTVTLLEKAASVVGSAIVQFGLIEDDWLTIRATSRDGPPASRRVSLTVRTPMTAAVESGAPVLLNDAPSFEADFPDVATVASEPWLGARAALPLRRSDGAVFGAIGFGWGGPMVFTRSLRSTITTVVDLAAQSLERSEFTDRQTRAALSLAEFAQYLAAANNRSDVESAVATRLRSTLRAQHVTLVDAAAQSDALHEIVRRGRTVVLSPGPALDSVRFLDDAGAVGVVPIRDADGSPVAAIVISWRRPTLASEALTAMLDTVGNMVGQTVERTQLYELEHGLVRDLQAELLRPLPDTPGLDSAALYEPASRSIDIGGDWYSAVQLAHHRVAFVIGDVLGHGVEAVAAMGRLQSVMIGLLTSLPRPEEVFTRASELIQDDGATLASALLVVVDTEFRTLDYLSAGHPPALLRIGDEIVALEGARQPLLGLRLAPTRMERMPFPIGSTLVMYTDGLVERRSEALDDGIARLAGLLHGSDSHLDAHALGALLLDGCREFPDAQRDDTAVLVVKSIAP